MPDFRDRLIDKPYYGPSDSTMMEVITAFNTRNSCSYEELLHTFGTINEKRLSVHLAKLVKEEKLVERQNDYSIPTSIEKR